MKKFVVSYDKNILGPPLGIFQTRGDAEEFIFSCVEEDAYYDFIYCIRTYTNPNPISSYFQDWQYHFNRENAYRRADDRDILFHPYSLVLSDYACNYVIDEVEEF